MTTSATLTQYTITGPENPITNVIIRYGLVDTNYDFSLYETSLDDVGLGITLSGVTSNNAILTDAEYDISLLPYIYASDAIIDIENDSDVFQTIISIGKSEVVGIDISEWATGQGVISYTISSGKGLVAVSTNTIVGNLLLVRVSGISEGVDNLIFNYATDTRQDCYTARICVEGDC